MAQAEEHLRARVKPQYINEFVTGIRNFWRTVNKEKCTKYIAHPQNVIPRVMEVRGELGNRFLAIGQIVSECIHMHITTMIRSTQCIWVVEHAAAFLIIC